MINLRGVSTKLYFNMNIIKEWKLTTPTVQQLQLV